MHTPDCGVQPIHSRRFSQGINLFLLSAAALTFEVSLTRLFSVAQFYHFAFMIVSLALLGYGAGGTALSMFPAILRSNPALRLRQFALAGAVSILASYLLTNWMPFDSFSLAWDRRQLIILFLHYLALAAPFFFSGLATGYVLSAFPASAGSTYAYNLLGSAAGCLIALSAPVVVGGEGMVVISAFLAVLAAILPFHGRRSSSLFRWTAVGYFIVLLLLFVSGLLKNPVLSFLELRISPYKSLSLTLQPADARIIFDRWNAFSRVDLVQSETIHTLPGLSYRYLNPLPEMAGLFVDGDDLSPVVKDIHDLAFSLYLPNALAFRLRPQASALILDPRGGLDILTALAMDTKRVTVVESNPLIAEAVDLYADPRLDLRLESGRTYLRRSNDRYDVIVLSLSSSYHPVRSGAYSLSEDYRYTLESFQDMLNRLNPGGLLVATRWLQIPPSEDLRLFALAVTALETTGGDPRTQIVAIRGFNTATVLVNNDEFTSEELTSIRKFTRERAFDLSYAPNIQPLETNRFNILPESIYYRIYTGLLESRSRQDFYDRYDYDVRPSSDDHPFFGHYFKWAQATGVIAGFGKTFQPFGGAGYFVLLALLGLALTSSLCLIIIPMMFRKTKWNREAVSYPHYHMRILIYFGFLGFAFLMVEMPLFQKFILYLGQPAYAFAIVLFSLLFFSGLGSLFNERIPLQWVLPALFLLILVMPAGLTRLITATLGLPIFHRIGLTFLTLFPVGFLMGVPFPAGIRLLAFNGSRNTRYSNNGSLERVPHEENTSDSGIPWIWAVNGASSVISSILSALLALTFGFNWVLRLGALCYGIAWLMAVGWARALHSPYRRL